MTGHRPAAAVALVALLGGAAIAAADTVSASLDVRVEVVHTATIAGTEPVSLDTSDPTATEDRDAAGEVRVKAARGTTYSISVSPSRTLMPGEHDLEYDLRVDESRSRARDSDASTAKVFTSTGDDAVSHAVHARIPAGRDVPEGSYGDEVVVTVEW